MEDNSTVPTIQDMLVLDILNNDEEFDARRLEELAESLLADITADLEAGDRTCNEPTTETPSGAECLPGSVVGTATECLEPCENSETDNSDSIKQKLDTNDNLQERLNGNCEEDMPSLSIELPHMDISTPETVYGTYDAKTNSITIVMEDGSTPVNEAVEEIYCDGVEPPAGDDVIECPSPAASPSQVYLNINCDSDDDDDILNFDPISTFLCPKRPIVSPLGKSPVHSVYSTNSDHGYESIIGSPVQSTLPLTEDTFEEIEDFSWHDSSFNELFPALI